MKTPKCRENPQMVIGLNFWMQSSRPKFLGVFVTIILYLGFFAENPEMNQDNMVLI